MTPWRSVPGTDWQRTSRSAPSCARDALPTQHLPTFGSRRTAVLFHSRTGGECVGRMPTARSQACERLVKRRRDAALGSSPCILPCSSACVVLATYEPLPALALWARRWGSRQPQRGSHARKKRRTQQPSALTSADNDRFDALLSYGNLASVSAATPLEPQAARFLLDKCVTCQDDAGA
jgi:hypothetical protein